VVIKNKLYKSLSNQSNDLKIKYKMINKYIKNSEIWYFIYFYDVYNVYYLMDKI
jgi:hypothetical protein